MVSRDYQAATRHYTCESGDDVEFHALYDNIHDIKLFREIRDNLQGKFCAKIRSSDKKFVSLGRIAYGGDHLKDGQSAIFDFMMMKKTLEHELVPDFSTMQVLARFHQFDCKYAAYDCKDSWKNRRNDGDGIPWYAEMSYSRDDNGRVEEEERKLQFGKIFEFDFDESKYQFFESWYGTELQLAFLWDDVESAPERTIRVLGNA